MRLITIAAILTCAHLFIGYYDTLWAEDNHRVFFIKHRPTWQTKFINLSPVMLTTNHWIS